ncbi:MAG: WbqC family protein [Saprospiraceae bacterium]|nr:WbqC family protein [Saprospiraceae bacterium]
MYIVKEKFKEFDIDVVFLQANRIEYKQFNIDFIPFLSIIDVLMFNNVSQARDLLNHYQLI